MLFPSSANASARRLLVAKALRSVADGYVSILLPAYLLELGLSAFRAGVLATATLVGSASLTLFAGVITSRFGHRRPLVWASVLMILTGLGFAGFSSRTCTGPRSWPDTASPAPCSLPWEPSWPHCRSSR